MESRVRDCEFDVKSANTPHSLTCIARCCAAFMMCSAYSLDGDTWFYSTVAAYNTTLRWADGRAQVLYRRERPKPVVSGNGTGALP